MTTSVEALQGRIIKVFNHGKVCLLQIAAESKKISALMSKEQTEDYKALCQRIKLGTYIRGNGYWQEGKKTDKEFVFLNLDYISENFLTKNETGFVSESPFNIDTFKKKYHSYLCVDSLCATNLACRSKMLFAIRHFLENRGYAEVNTPILNKNFYAGGAQPFLTHMLDSGSDMYMRITSEIALKMVVGGGFPKVFEIGSSFRNGSVKSKYLTPFNCAEIYTTFISEEDNLNMAEAIIKSIEKEISPIIKENGFESIISFDGKIPRISFDEYYFTKTGQQFNWDNYMTDESTYKDESNAVYKQLKNDLFKDQVEPIFITDLPAGNSPLISCKSEKILYRSYLVANKATLMEIAIGETDPEQILKKMERQSFNDDYKRDYSNFIHAFKMGMPPIGSIFIGIDRVIPAFLGIENLNDLSMSL